MRDPVTQTGSRLTAKIFHSIAPSLPTIEVRQLHCRILIPMGGQCDAYRKKGNECAPKPFRDCEIPDLTTESMIGSRGGRVVPAHGIHRSPTMLKGGEAYVGNAIP